MHVCAVFLGNDDRGPTGRVEVSPRDGSALLDRFVLAEEARDKGRVGQGRVGERRKDFDVSVTSRRAREGRRRSESVPVP